MGIIPNEYFKFAGMSSLDFGLRISGNGTFPQPERDVETIEVAGKNGSLHIDNGRFRNVEIVYHAFIFEDFNANYAALKAFLSSQKGYKRLEDSYSPNTYRLAAYKGALKPEMSTRNKAGKFDIVFDCDPRRFLQSGLDVESVPTNSSRTIVNPTRFEALPLITASVGTIRNSSYFYVGEYKVDIIEQISDLIIDCELQEAYKDSTSYNNKITLRNHEFPVLMPGENVISTPFSLSKLEIIPRYWTV